MMMVGSRLKKGLQTILSELAWKEDKNKGFNLSTFSSFVPFMLFSAFDNFGHEECGRGKKLVVLENDSR
jgi:hypothetical protein